MFIYNSTVDPWTFPDRPTLRRLDPDAVPWDPASTRRRCEAYRDLFASHCAERRALLARLRHLDDSLHVLAHVVCEHSPGRPRDEVARELAAMIPAYDDVEAPTVHVAATTAEILQGPK